MTALQPIKKQAYRIVFWQLMIIMGLAVVLLLLRGLQNGISAFLGGLAYWLPTLAFVWRVFARANMRAAKQFVALFFAGEATKLILSAILFVFMAKYLPVSTPSLMAGYLGAIIAFWMSSIYFLSRNNQEEGL